MILIAFASRLSLVFHKEVNCFSIVSKTTFSVREFSDLGTFDFLSIDNNPP
jgi:hypothetical protein